MEQHTFENTVAVEVRHKRGDELRHQIFRHQIFLGYYALF